MSRAFVIALSVAVVATAANAHSKKPRPSDLCAIAMQGLSSAWLCRGAGEGGVILGPAAESVQVDALVHAARDGELRFKTYFNTDLPLYAVVLDLDDQSRKSLEAARFAVILPWLSPEKKKAMLETQIRRSVEQQIADKGLPPAQVEALVQQALAKATAQGAGGSTASREGTIIAHELGHLLFSKSYWPKGWEGQREHTGYGGPGPDWLDETAAVLHEDEALTADRRRQFAMIYTDRTTGSPLERMSKDKLTDLPAFLTQEHPVNRRAREAAKLAKERGDLPSSGGVLQLTGQEATALSQDGLLFYLQARMFADFMLAHTGDQKIFHSISKEIASGEEFPAWLRANGKKHRLATDVPGLHRQWLEWVEKTVREAQ